MDVYENSTVTLKAEFTDDYDEPLYPSTSFTPYVKVFRDKQLITKAFIAPDVIQGEWLAHVDIPDLELQDRVSLTAIWYFVDDAGNKHTQKETLTVLPSTQDLCRDLVIIGSNEGEVVLPFIPTKAKPLVKANLGLGIAGSPEIPSDTLRFSLYQNNDAIYEDVDWTEEPIRIQSEGVNSRVTLPMLVEPSINPYTLIVYFKPTKGKSQTLTYRVFVPTPQIMKAAEMVEAYCNKARISDIIPELDYNTPFLLDCLQRGLEEFNALGTIITNFTGENMQGRLLQVWVICSVHSALSMQFLAESALAMDFGGQDVSLNVDRTQGIESALGRIQEKIDSVVIPFKKLLVRDGVLGGDGSIGGQAINNKGSVGLLSLSNNPMTRYGYRTNYNNRRSF